MTSQPNEPQGQVAEPAVDSPHPALKLRHTLQGGHLCSVYRMALSPDGRILAAPTRSEGGRVQLWDMYSGRVLRMLEHEETILCVGWSPDGKTLATGNWTSSNGNEKVVLWDAMTGGKIRTLVGKGSGVDCLAWSPEGKILATCSNRSFRLWDAAGGVLLREFQSKHSDHVEDVVAWSPNGQRLCSGSWDQTVKLWDVNTGNDIRILKGHDIFVYTVAWSPNGQHIASGSNDQTVRIWDAETGLPQYILEGHTAKMLTVAFLDSGRLLASLGEDGKVIFWRTDTWAEVLHVDKIGAAYTFDHANLAVHPTLPLMAVRGPAPSAINIWDIDFARLRGSKSATSSLFYVNAKAVLLGDSGVGKSGLGIRIAEKQFRHTESTHGAQFWHFPTERLPALPPHIQAELTLWDLAGQPEYRLTHQLFLDDTDAALLLFDCSDANDPFHGVPYWAKVLKKHAPAHAKKFLVSSRTDVSPVTVHRRDINKALGDYGLDDHFKTCAKTGEGVQEVFQRLLNEIPWDQLPRTSTPKLFHAVREYLLELKSAGSTLLTLQTLREGLKRHHAGDDTIQEEAEKVSVRYWSVSDPINQPLATYKPEFDTVVRLLQNRGLVFRLEPKPGEVYVLLKPELVNQYGATIIQAARNHPQGIGAVAEHDVLTGNIPFTGVERLPQGDERLVLDATAELLLRHDLGFREMGYLVFPSQINVTRQAPEQSHPRTEVAYRFSGSIETIYASLVVRLNYTDFFRREDQWKYAVEFSRGGHRLGFSMRQVEEGTGELEIYFQPGVNEFDRVTFIRFITEHLRAKGMDIQEQIRLYCPGCTREVTNREAIEARVQDGELDIPCQFCKTDVVIPQSVEEIYRREPALGEKQRQLTETVENRTEQEIRELRADQQQYTAAEDERIHILHLSDLHFGDDKLAGVCRMQLETDLKQELGIKRLDYLVISGDIANRSTEQEYETAFAMVDGLVKRFGLDASRVVVVPGNHDLNWDLSEKAYPFVTKRKLPATLPEDRFIPAGEAGALLRDDEPYKQRFAHFNSHFYRRVYTGQDYPTDYADQFLLVERPADRMLFLGLNSCWQLDHHFRERAGINMEALSKALDCMQDGRFDGWLKIAVWHHPVTGRQGMNDEPMQLLAVQGFQIVLHGHIHEAIAQNFYHDDRRGIRIIGAGTFGAPAHEQVTGIPLQYNLLTLDPKTGRMKVNTRKKEGADGAWWADARWGDKNSPEPFYEFIVNNYVKQG
jgi:WD40 repeat protein/GTPase SAR1 family protein/predicted phosphodiesterase